MKKKNPKRKFFLTFFSMQLYSADAMIFLKEFLFCFALENVKKNALKSCSLSAPSFFFTSTAQLPKPAQN